MFSVDMKRKKRFKKKWAKPAKQKTFGTIMIAIALFPFNLILSEILGLVPNIYTYIWYIIYSVAIYIIHHYNIAILYIIYHIYTHHI